MTLRELLSSDPVARAEHELAQAQVSARFGSRTPEGVSGLALRPFVEIAPWRYWDDRSVDLALALLEKDASRSIAAVVARTASIDRGIDELFRPSARGVDEGARSGDSASEIVTLATEWIPEYLRLVEHVFGNLLAPIWAALKKGGSGGHFDLRGATTFMRSQGHDALLGGFTEEVRNAIAHGKVRLTAFEIEFGDVRPVCLTRSAFLDALDELGRTCNAFAIALMLFIAKHQGDVVRSGGVPRAMATRFVAGAVGRRNCRVAGSVESETPLAGKQLHIAVEMTERHRAHVLGQCARVAYQFIQVLGAARYERLEIEVHHGEPVASLSIVKPQELIALVARGAPIEALSTAFDDTQLLWYDEPAWRTRLRAWRVIAGSTWRLVRHQIIMNWHAARLCLGKGRFRVREVRNLSVDGIARVQVLAVLLRPEDADDLAVVNEVLRELVKVGRRRFVRSRMGTLDRGVAWPRRPVHVWVDLYRSDGTLRWLKSGGWPKGHLVAVAERTWGRRAAIKVPNPEHVYRKIRIRYRMDIDAARAAMAKATELFEKLGQRDGTQPLA
jgi:hypothetical protein